MTGCLSKRGYGILVSSAIKSDHSWPQSQVKHINDTMTNPNINVIFIGHVDAGKSTLGGQILLQTGVVDTRTIDKYKRIAKEKGRESWYLAYALDSNEEERNKGKTVDIARRYFETTNRRCTILDAPGHAAYVKNMVSEVGLADVAVLVVSAKTGEFESGFCTAGIGGQTSEHVLLAKSFGVENLIVAVNKMDMSFDCETWSKTRFDQIVASLKPYLNRIGYRNKSHVQFIPLSGYEATNILVNNGVCKWYTGPSLLNLLNSQPIDESKRNQGLRAPIIQRYQDMGCLVLYVNIQTGSLTVGQEIMVMPRNQLVKIHSMNVGEQENASCAVAGDNVEIFIKDEIDANVGGVVCSPGDTCFVAKEFVAEFVLFDDRVMFTPGFRATLHLHTAMSQVVVKKLLSLTGKSVEAKERRVVGKVGSVQTVLFELDDPLCLEKFETNALMGRFVIRNDRTLGVGKVTRIKPL